MDDPTVPTTIRLPSSLRERARELAQRERRSVSNLIVLLLEEAVEARGRSERAA